MYLTKYIAAHNMDSRFHILIRLTCAWVAFSWLTISCLWPSLHRCFVEMQVRWMPFFCGIRSLPPDQHTGTVSIVLLVNISYASSLRSGGCSPSPLPGIPMHAQHTHHNASRTGGEESTHGAVPSATPRTRHSGPGPCPPAMISYAVG
ncbi:hypothetical protein LZ30DRAFT_712998, partial [Colletotrichum cereale]